MPSVIERPKMTKAMYQALKRHIMREREKKKQEQEQDALIERMRKERELKKLKEAEDSLTLEQTKEQVQQLEVKLEGLKQEKTKLFSQLKKVLHQESEAKKRALIKEQSELMSLPYAHNIPVSGHPMLLQSVSGRPTLYKAQQQLIQPLKRPRSPSPTPSGTVYQHYVKHSSYMPPQTDYKSASYTQGQPGQVAYVAPPGPSYPAHSAAYAGSQSTPGKYNQPGQSTPGKYNQPGQSAFSSYPSHYTHQQKQTKEQYPIATSYPLQRMQQQTGFLGSPHSHTSTIPLQQQLEQANQKSGFNEEKYKMQQQQQQQHIPGMAPLSGQQTRLMTPAIQIQQQQQQPKGSIVTGYSARAQAPPASTSSYQPTSQTNFSSPQANPGRPHNYLGQQPNRFY